MILDEWLKGDIKVINEDMINRSLADLQEETDELDRLVYQQGKYWEAFIRFTMYVSFMNNAIQQQPSKLPKIIQRLLEWIQKIKAILDKSVQNIGAKGYTIGVSAPWGVSVSVSF